MIECISCLSDWIKAKYYTYGWFWANFLDLGFAACFFSASAALRGFGGWLY
jgi:hypothetical protein